MPQNFSGQNLRGRSFKGQDLINADFSGADIQGTDFSQAVLTNANFTKAKTGLKRWAEIFLVLSSVLLAVASGAIIAVAGSRLEGLLTSEEQIHLVAGIASIAMVILFLGTTIWRGLSFALMVVAIALALFLIVAAFVVALGKGTGEGAAIAFASVSVIIFVAIVGTLARTVARIVAGCIFFLVAISAAVVGRSYGGGLLTTSVALASSLVSRNALAGQSKYALVHQIAITISSLGGTNFQGADLTNADFSQAFLQNANFNQAILDGVNWQGAQKRNLAKF